MRSPRLLPVLVSAVVAVIWLPMSSVTAVVSDEELAQAKDDLVALEAELVRARDDAEELEDHLAWVNGLVDQEKAEMAGLDGELSDLELQMEASRVRIDELQASFDEVIRRSFMDGGTARMQVFFEEDDPRVAQEKLTVIDAIAEHQLDLAQQTSEAKEALLAQSTVAEGKAREQSVLLSEIRDQRAGLIDQSKELDKALETLDDTHTELLEKVSDLKNLLSESDLDRLRRTLKGPESITYGQWAQLMLNELKAPTCKENMITMIAWQANEGTDAQWNPLATTYYLPGATEFNWVGVRNFVSLEQGLKATRLTLERGWDLYGYGEIVTSLRDCAKAEITAQYISDSSWCCPGGSYVIGLVDNVRESYQTYAKI